MKPKIDEENIKTAMLKGIIEHYNGMTLHMPYMYSELLKDLMNESESEQVIADGYELYKTLLAKQLDGVPLPTALLCLYYCSAEIVLQHVQSMTSTHTINDNMQSYIG